MSETRVYNADEVDRYVADLRDQIAALNREIEGLRAEVELGASATRDEATERALGRALLQAQLAADRAADDASRESDRILAEAQRQRCEILDEARKEHALILDEARREAAGLVAEAHQESGRRLGGMKRQWDESPVAGAPWRTLDRAPFDGSPPTPPGSRAPAD